MRKKFKFIIIALIGIASFTTLIIVYFNLKQASPTLEKVEGLNLYVDYNNGSIKIRENFTLEGGKTTAFDSLSKWCIVKYSIYGREFFVREIDGIGGNWLYYVNNHSPGDASNLYPLENGDSIRWERV
jgi:hypothetical protein